MSSTSDSEEPWDSRRGTLADYAPDEAPYVPSLVMQCLDEVEFRYTEEESLYGKGGDIKKAKALVADYLKMKKMPYLNDIDIKTITLILKQFLASLSDTLITDQVRNEFIEASIINESGQRYRAFCDAMEQLPEPNRDTLVHLLRHLRTVVEYGRSSIRNLAEVFGPIVVGGSSQYLTPSLLMLSREDQIQVFESLLELEDCDNDDDW
ncbi:rac GTPase-activating protein 1-like [Venturia canescens]|uniref:rac GTPase-activating protein 1-like n=1 Tax=Venturia canescens TaxID=32260 RepID=UPI001C9CC381|nr:rac GTPase-activating protein 1-like [Venturia canescens]